MLLFEFLSFSEKSCELWVNKQSSRGEINYEQIINGLQFSMRGSLTISNFFQKFFFSIQAIVK